MENTSYNSSLFVTRTYTCGDLDVKVLPQPMLGYVDIPEQLLWKQQSIARLFSVVTFLFIFAIKS